MTDKPTAEDVVRWMENRAKWEGGHAEQAAAIRALKGAKP